MTKLLDTQEVRLFPKTGTAKNAFLGLGADIEKYAILEEQGTARNLHKLNLKNSIYDETVEV